MKLEAGELRHWAEEAATHERRMAAGIKGMSEISGNVACEVEPNEGDEYPPRGGVEGA